MSKYKEIIFIFTKDRPNVLNETIGHFKNFDDKVFIIDDSYYELNQKCNREVLKLLPNANYYGKSEFIESAILHNLESQKYNSIYKQLGDAEWNLGYARNYALFLSKIHNAYKVLFMDDDIVIPKEEIINNSFSLLEQFDFVGTNIGGMIDDSILGHISNDIGFKDTDERNMSGGFLAFNPKRIRFPFLNIYNEDWIWLFLHSNEEKYLQPDFVIQKYSDPYFDYENKILFQEYGEIIISGILLAKEKENFELLTLKIFWESVIGERKFYISKLYELAKISKRKDLTVMIKWLLQNYSQYGSCYFSECFNDYLNVKQKFENVYNCV